MINVSTDWDLEMLIFTVQQQWLEAHPEPRPVLEHIPSQPILSLRQRLSLNPSLLLDTFLA